MLLALTERVKNYTDFTVYRNLPMRKFLVLIFHLFGDV